MSFESSRMRSITFVLSLAFASAVAAAEDVPIVQSATFVRVVDEKRLPVEDAEVGATRIYGNMLLRDNCWRYMVGPVASDAEGVARFVGKEELLPSLAIYARHGKRNLVGVSTLGDTHQPEMLTVTMKPACLVSGSFVCPELESRGKTLLGTGVCVKLDGRFIIERWDAEPQFEFELPAGKYQLYLSSLTDTYHVIQALNVPDHAKTVKLDPIALRPTKLKLLELDHAPAPEFTGIVAWKNSEPLTFSKLRGKVVLLDFWGYWCNPCLDALPRLCEIYRQYSDRGLVIIGIHVDLGGEIDSVAKLDEKLAPIRTSALNGTDIPFPVALIPGKDVSYGPGTARMARSELDAAYGIQTYPTQVLIDRNGRVVRRLDIRNDSDIEHLVSVLGLPEDVDRSR